MEEYFRLRQTNEEVQEAIDRALSNTGSSLTKDIVPSIDLGGIRAGLTLAEGKPLEDVLEDMLTPAVNPELTEPTASFAYTGPEVVKVGENISSATAVITFDRGAINPQFTADSPYRAGDGTFTLEVTGADSPVSETNSTGTFNIPTFKKSGAGNMVVHGTVSYSHGPQPKDSEGNNYESPLPAGSFTFEKTIKVVLPFLYGVSNTATVDLLTGLTEVVAEKGEQACSYTTANKYMVFAYDSDYGDLVSILDPNSNETISGWAKSVLGDYNVYVAILPTTDTGARYTFKFNY